MSAEYSYYDASGIRRYVDNNDFLLLGSWSAAGTKT